MELTGLHHVTAVTANAAENLAFYTRIMGLRLVKKTVNQDDVSAYHLFYGDAIGHAGTEVTFFDWSAIGPNRPGTGAISGIGLRVPGPALEWWARHLSDAGFAHGGIETIGGRATLEFADHEGQVLRLVDNADAASEATPWERSPVPAWAFVRGLDSVELTVRNLAPTARFLTDVLGMRQTRAYERLGVQTTVLEMGAGGPGTEVMVVENADLPRHQLGAGGVHHIAFRTPDVAAQTAWRDRIQAAGIATSGIIDRFYFQSLYFRDPSGIQYEIATDGPGFATDEDPAHLGARLALPPFLEPQRAQIEAGLRPLV